MNHPVAALLAALLTTPAFAADPQPTPAPATAEASFPVVSAQDVKTLVASGKAVLLDANGSESFAEGHLPGSLDFAALGDGLAAKLPADKSAPIVAYCGGPGCSAWKRAATAVAAIGYTNVQHFKGGLSGWKESGGTLVQ